MKVGLLLMSNFLEAVGAGTLFGGGVVTVFYIWFFLMTYFQFKKETEKKLETVTDLLNKIQYLVSQGMDQPDKVISTESVPVTDDIQQKIGFHLNNKDGV